MSLTVPSSAELATFIGADSYTNESALDEALEVAVAMVDERLAGGTYREIPQVVYNLIIKEVAHAAYKRGDSVSGAVDSMYENGSQRWEPKDELNRVWPKLRRYVSPFPMPVVEE